jgi:hypothetical protein
MCTYERVYALGANLSSKLGCKLVPNGPSWAATSLDVLWPLGMYIFMLHSEQRWKASTNWNEISWESRSLNKKHLRIGIKLGKSKASIKSIY